MLMGIYIQVPINSPFSQPITSHPPPETSNSIQYTNSQAMEASHSTNFLAQNTILIILSTQLPPSLSSPPSLKQMSNSSNRHAVSRLTLHSVSTRSQLEQV
ncbi:hypothetical protein L6452_14648 [Arctium lappa]|uniref:Uncharacterized protein n=1 Tax=Arctium lappa TaxID=4217 RepID=A0ACB9CLK4_ARCLA|nr:hypothetical protein L6452_14648 [Arctium lappa]